MVRLSHYLQSNSSVFLPFSARFVEAAALINTGKQDRKVDRSEEKTLPHHVSSYFQLYSQLAAFPVCT